LHGTTALVVNRPTPLTLSHLDLPRFHAFGRCRLFHGGVFESELGQDKTAPNANPIRRKMTSGHNLLSNLQPQPGSSGFEAHNFSPNHWIHAVEGIKGSTALGGGIFLGGSLQDASCTVSVGMAEPNDFKFFHRQLNFEGGQLEKTFYEGLWDVIDDDDEEAKHRILFDGSIPGA